MARFSDIPSFVSYMNAPNRYELYVLDEGEKPYVTSHMLPEGYSPLDSFRVEVTEDTKIPNAATVKIVKQDHTLANMIRGCVNIVFTFAKLSLQHRCSAANFSLCHRFYSLAIRFPIHYTRISWLRFRRTAQSPRRLLLSRRARS